MKKKKIYLFARIFESKINDALCKWALIFAVLYFVIRAGVYMICKV